MAIRVNVTGTSNDVGFGAVGQSVWPAPEGVPEGTTPPVGDRRVADIAAELPGVTVGTHQRAAIGAFLALGVEAL
jgi:hypothetical protein